MSYCRVPRPWAAAKVRGMPTPEGTLTYTYDPANQLHSVIQLNHPNPSNNTNTFGYDPLGNLTALTDENLHTTQNVFDVLNEPVSKTLPDQTLTETRQYDAAGNLVSLTHFNGVTTTYTYDAQNRKLTQATPGEPTISFTYTPTGKYLTSAAGDGTVNYSYDPLDRLTTKATPEGTLSYTYYANGNVESIVSSNNRRKRGIDTEISDAGRSDVSAMCDTIGKATVPTRNVDRELVLPPPRRLFLP